NNTDIGDPLTVNVDTPSTLFVFGRVESRVTCATNQGCSRHYGLYVDGQQVLGTLVEVYGPIGGTGGDAFAVFGTISVGAGQHSVRFRAGNTQYVTNFLDLYTNIGAIQLGNT